MVLSPASHGSRPPLSDITNGQSQDSTSDIPGFGTDDPLNQVPGQFESPHDFFSEEALVIQPRPRPSKEYLDGLVTHFEGQMTQLGTPSMCFQKVFGYSPQDFDSLESFLYDFHSRSTGSSMNEVMRIGNHLLLKLKNVEEAYRYIGQDPQYADFKNTLSRIWVMRDRLIVVRMTAAGMLAAITGERPPCVETTMNNKEGKKLYDFVKWYAYSLGYRIGGIDGLVYTQSTCLHEGVLHKTRHWQHVTRLPQPGESQLMTAVDLIDECFKVNRLGEEMVNINTSSTVKKDCAERMQRNDEDLQLWPISRHLHSFENGTLCIKEHRWYPMSEGCPMDARTGMPLRAASFHPYPLTDAIRMLRGGFEGLGAHAEGETWWADKSTTQLVLDTILEHQRVPDDARRVLLAMIGATLFDIGEYLPHPTIPGRQMMNKLEVILFIWGRAGVGKSTILNMISAMYNDNTDLVGLLENQSDESFGLDKIKHAFVVIAQDIDSKFNLSPTQLTGMTSGEKVVIRAKFKNDIIVPNWRAMFAMAGNESFTTREQANAGNRLTRRTVAFCFGQKVLEHNRSLLDQMKAEMPKLIWVCSWALKALLAELGEHRGMATMVTRVQYLSDCVDDLNSTSRLMRKWLEETPQIIYGPGLWVEVDFLRNNFNDWKQQNGLRGSQSSGPYLEWTATAVDDAFSYAERRLCGNPIEPKSTAGIPRPDLHPLEAARAKKVFTGITWREMHPRAGAPEQGPRPDAAEREGALEFQQAAPFLSGPH
ncbi:hypothetical protein WJX74_004732 [Apatococcus lobatus]|uniref:NrS-1 polymerase-like helicase domain-containing protein n=1 Tax=Apatococcus lobatus TaxID=904363 RepID=A0AAW1R0G4_9CHLO